MLESKLRARHVSSVSVYCSTLVGKQLPPPHPENHSMPNRCSPCHDYDLVCNRPASFQTVGAAGFRVPLDIALASSVLPMACKACRPSIRSLAVTADMRLYNSARRGNAALQFDTRINYLIAGLEKLKFRLQPNAWFWERTRSGNCLSSRN